MEELEIPIFQKGYDLYKTFYSYRDHIAKQDRYTLWQRCENIVLDLLQSIILASQQPKSEKVGSLSQASVQLNLLRIQLRLAKDLKVIDPTKYILLEEPIDEIGRMLGGWRRSLNVAPPRAFSLFVDLLRVRDSAERTTDQGWNYGCHPSFC